MDQPEQYGEAWAEGYDRYVEALALDTLGAVHFLKQRAKGSVLELGVGTGRLALPLATQGVEVHGIDASCKMIEVLRAKDHRKLVQVHQLDYSDFTLGEHFSLIYGPFNALIMLPDREDQIKCLRCVAACMLPNSLLVLEVDVPDLASYTNNMKMQIVNSDSHFVEIQLTRHRRVDQRIDSYHITFGTSAQPQLRFVAQRYVGLSELDLMAHLAGFRLVERFSDWRETPFTHQSRKHVSVFQLTQPPSAGAR